MGGGGRGGGPWLGPRAALAAMGPGGPAMGPPKRLVMSAPSFYPPPEKMSFFKVRLLV